MGNRTEALLCRSKEDNKSLSLYSHHHTFHFHAFLLSYFYNFLEDNYTFGDENSLVARSTIESRLIDIPNCWICVDVGRTRAISPSHITVMHGCSDKVGNTYSCSLSFFISEFLLLFFNF